MNGRPVGWYCTNSMSLSGAPARYASAMPSPVLMLAFVVNGKTFPQPPVASTTALAVMAWIRPVVSSIATTPQHPAVVDQEPGDEPLVVPLHRGILQGRLEQRVQHVEPGLVGGEPGAHLLHPAERPDRDPAVVLPAPRAAPVLELEELPGASSMKASMASWSPSQSLPEMVS